MNIAVVGIGYWGPNLIRNCIENPDIQNVYAYDIDESRLRFIQSKYRSVIINKSYHDIVKDDSIDSVIIATPVFSHYSLAKKSIEAGKNVIIEKPMASSVKECEELINLSIKNNVLLMVDHTFIYTSAVRKIKELIDKGEIGDLYYYDSVRINLGLFQHDVNVIWDLATHDFSIMDYLVQKKQKTIMAVGSDHVKEEMEDIAYIHVTFENGLIAHFHVNWMSPVKVRKVIIAGSKKMITYDDLETSDKVKVYDKGVEIIEKEDVYKTLVQYRTGDMYIPQLYNIEALKEMTAHFVDCVKNNKKPVTSAESGLNVVRLLEASENSIKNGGRVILL